MLSIIPKYNHFGIQFAYNYSEQANAKTLWKYTLD